MKQMWKALLILTVLLSFLVVQGYAAGSVSVSTDGTTSAGSSITVTVSVHNASAVKGIAVVPQYDSSIFDLVSGSWHISGLLADFSVSSGDGVLAFADATNVSGVIFSFVLRVKETAKMGTQSVGCSVVLSDADNQNVSLYGSASVAIACNHSFTEANPDTQYFKNDATCTTGPLYYYSCTYCGEKGNETFEYGDPVSHSFTAQTISDRYVYAKGSCTERAIYYYSCTRCGQRGTETFDGPDPSHAFESTWSMDEQSHWYACANCDEVRNQEAHVPGDPATEDAAQLCLVCDYEIHARLEHIHDYSMVWYSSEQIHWGLCVCGEYSTEQSHIWGTGEVVVEATVEQHGVRRYTCTACGREKIELTDKLEMPGPTQPTEPPTQPTEPPTQPTEPPTQPTEPPTEPTGPPTQPTEPTMKPVRPDEVVEEDTNGSFGLGMVLGMFIGAVLCGGACWMILRKKMD